MTIADAAHILNLQPNRGSVHRRIRQLLEARGETPGTLMQDGILTPQAERAVREATLATKARGDRQPEATEDEETPQSVAAYARLQAEHEVLRQELERVTAYLDDCDRLLFAMTRTVDALEERVQDLEAMKRQSLRERFVEATRVLVVRPVRQVETGPEVYYSNVLARGAER